MKRAIQTRLQGLSQCRVLTRLGLISILLLVLGYVALIALVPR